MKAKTRQAMVSALGVLNQWLDRDTQDSEEEQAEQWDEVVRLAREAWALHTAELATCDQPAFAGAYYNPARDDERLTVQLGRVFDAMSDGGWHTLESLQKATGDPAASVSAQIRHLRKPQHGSWLVDVESDNDVGTLYWYRLRNPDGSELPPVVPLLPATPADSVG